MLPQTGEASCTMRQSSVVEVRQYVRHRLTGIHTQREKVIAAVNNIAQKAEISASLLFHQQDDKQVFFEFPSVVFQLEFYLKQLIDVYHQLEGKHKDVSQESDSSSTSHNVSAVSASWSDQQMCNIPDHMLHNNSVKAFDDTVHSCVEQLSRVRLYEDGSICNLTSTTEYDSKEDLNSAANEQHPYQHQLLQNRQHTLLKRTKLKHLLQCIADCDLDMMNTPSIDAELQLIINYGHGPELLQMCFKERSVLEVSVAEVINPSSFWLQVHDPEILEMTDALTIYNKSLKKCDWGYCLRCEPEQNMNVCVKYGETDVWCRARIMSISPAHAPGSIEVFCVDYGRSMITTLDSIRQLHPKFARLPCHSLSCALSQIGPPDGTSVWPSQTVNEFRQFVQSLPVFIAVISSHPVNPPYLVQLHTIELLSNDTLKDAADLMFSVNGDVAKLMVCNKKACHVNNQFVVNLYHEAVNEAAPEVTAKASEANCHRYLSASSAREHTAEMDSVLCRKQADLPRTEAPDGKIPLDACDSSFHVALQEMTRDQETDNAGSAITAMPAEHHITSKDNRTFVQQNTFQRNISNRQMATDEMVESSVDDKHHVDDDVSLSERTSASDIVSSEDGSSPVDITKELRHHQDYTSSNLCSVSELEHGKISVQNDNPSDLQVPAYKPKEITVPNSGFITFLVAYAESPSKFWIHILNQESQEALDTLANELNEYFNTNDKFLLKRYLNVDKIELNSPCCARFQGDNTFYRARIVGLRYSLEDDLHKCKHNSSVRSSSDKEISDVLVQYVDFGNIEWVSITDVYPLPPRLLEVPSQAVCCTLASVCPVKPVNAPQQTITHRNDDDLVMINNDSYEWPETAVSAFQELVDFEQPLVGYVKGVNNYSKISPDIDSPLPLILMDTSGEDTVYIHEELIRSGHATSTEVVHLSDDKMNVSEDRNSNQEDSRALMEFQPSAEDYYSEKNSYFVDVDDPSVAMFGYKRQDEKRICFYYNKSGYCRKGENCRFEHVRTYGLSTTDKKAVFEAADLTSYITLPDVGSWVALEVTTVISPSHFYAIFPFGTRPIWRILEDEKLKKGDNDADDYSVLDSLDELNEAMTEKYSAIVHRDTDYTVYAKGTVVACRFTEDSRFYRARILTSVPDSQMVLVFYVDYGNREWVPESHIRQIVPEFLLLPFQAVECILPLKPPGTSNTWNNKSDTRFFKEFVEEKILYAKVLESGSSGCLVVDLYDSTCGDICINQYLIDNNVAVPSHYLDSITADNRSSNKIQLLQSNTLPG